MYTESPKQKIKICCNFKRGVIKEQLGKEVPVIVHELEYYDLPIMWTTRSNPKSLIDEFLKSYNDGCL